MAKTYNIYQDGVKVQEGVAELTKTITGLTPNTSYKFEVTAVEEGVESAKSTAVTAKTNPRKEYANRANFKKGFLGPYRQIDRASRFFRFNRA